MLSIVNLLTSNNIIIQKCFYHIAETQKAPERSGGQEVRGRGALTPQPTRTAVYGQRGVRERRLAKGRRRERGSHAMFTVLPGKSPCVKPNIDVG